jgi:hypothetical protein
MFLYFSSNLTLILASPLDQFGADSFGTDLIDFLICDFLDILGMLNVKNFLNLRSFVITFISLYFLRRWLPPIYTIYVIYNAFTAPLLTYYLFSADGILWPRTLFLFSCFFGIFIFAIYCWYSEGPLNGWKEDWKKNDMWGLCASVFHLLFLILFFVMLVALIF